MQRPEFDTAPIARRDAIALFAALLALPTAAEAQPATGAQPAAGAPRPAILDKPAFLQASALVTGLEPGQLTGMTDVLLALLQPQAPIVLQLADLARTNPPDLGAAIAGTPMEPVARALAAAWYTGMQGAGAQARVISYEDAAAWKAAGYDAVPGMCAGEFGFWSEPPAPDPSAATPAKL